MADSHPKNLDPRPKRRRDEDSPYEIYTAGINTAHPRFYLFFKDGGGVKRWMEIDKAGTGPFQGRPAPAARRGILPGVHG